MANIATAPTNKITFKMNNIYNESFFGLKMEGRVIPLMASQFHGLVLLIPNYQYLVTTIEKLSLYLYLIMLQV